MYKLLDTVALTHDIPEAGLCCGDLGAVVELHSDKAMEVEFVAASGRTQALLTLRVDEVRRLGDRDVLSVRTLEATNG